jgi:S1-C subfamily serine protease
MFYGPQKERFSGMGSGVIIDSDGIVVTNDHVIRMRGQVGQLDVILTNGRKFRAKVVKDFPEQDLAILRIEGKNFPYLNIGSSKDVQPGQTVLAIGNPFGDALNGGLSYGEPTVTRGIISATKRNLTAPTDEGNGDRYYRSMIQTDAAINPGNSGGPLIDLRGNLIGINTAIYSESGGSVGIGFAIPADRVSLILENVRKKNDVGQWYTGIAVQDLTRDIADALGFRGDGGSVITKVENGSPADRSGLRRGDVITRVNGFVIGNSEELISMFRGSVPGETIRLTVFREGKAFDAELKVGSR